MLNEYSMSNKDHVFRLVENGEITVSEALSIIRKNSTEGKPTFDIPKADKIEQIHQELKGLIGLETVKQLVQEIYAFVEIQQKRLLMQLISEPIALHMIFSGNPGVGKTTVARLIGKLFSEMGVLSKGHLVEVERADLVAEYIGQTAQKTREQLRKASGGILFIDEAYSLARGGEKDFGKEAIDTMVKTMEDQRGNLIIILAGYSQPMKEFLQTNPGLSSRFPIKIEFPDYSAFELFKIAELMLSERDYQLNKAARRKLYRMIEELKATETTNFGNARTIRNVIEQAIRRQAVRLVNLANLSRTDLMEISAEDLQGAIKS